MQLELYINNALADIGDESIIAVTKTYETVENPLNYYAEYSKTIKLPLTERNNAIFSNFNRQDSIVANVTVDYTKKFPFLLLNNGEKVMQGTLKLENANTIYTDESYEVTLYSTFGLIMNTLGLLTFNPHATEIDPQYIIETPFDKLTINRDIVKMSFEQQSHNINGNDVLDWIGFIPTYQGMYDDFSSDKEQILPNGRTEDMSRERDEHYTREFRSYYQQPFVWVDKLWQVAKEKIEAVTDYSFILDRSWFTANNPYYSDLIYTCPSLFKSDDSGLDLNVVFPTKSNFLVFNKPSRSIPLNESNVLQLTGFNPSGDTELVSDDVFNPDGTLGATKFQSNFRFTLYAPKQNIITGGGYARIRDDNPFYVIFKAVNAETGEEIYGARKKYLIYSEDSDHLSSSYDCIDIDISECDDPDITNEPSTRTVAYQGGSSYGEPHAYGDGYYWECDLDVVLNVQENVPYKIYVDIHNYNNDKPFESSDTSLTPRWDWAWKDFFETDWNRDRGYTVYLDLLNGYVETEGHNRSSSDLSLYRIFPKETTLRDVLLNYTKMCGLVWDIDEDAKTVTVMTRNRFFNDYTIKDWSDKIDRSKDFKLQPLTFDYKYVTFNYDEGDCGRLKAYESKYQNTYGAKKLDTGYEFNTEEKELFDGLVSSIVCQKKQISVMMNTEYENRSGFMGYDFKVLPNEHYVDNDDDGQNAGMSGAFYFRNGTFAPDPQLSRWDTEGRYVVTVSDDSEHQISTGEYCWNSCGENVALCYALPDVSTVSNAYGDQKYSVHFERPAEYYMQMNGQINYLYNSYWKRYIDERYCSQNKKLTAYFYINPKEFTEIDFREFVKLDNVLYHIDKIYDYNFNSNAPVKMDLAQVWDLSAYTEGQLSLPYLFTDPSIITLSTNNTTDYTKVDVYCSGDWALVASSLPSWVSAYKSGNDLMIKPNSTTQLARTGYITLNYVGSIETVRVLVMQAPQADCRIDTDKSTLVFGWESGSEIVTIDTSATTLNAIEVTTDRNWISARITEYTSTEPTFPSTGLHLLVSVRYNNSTIGRNGTVTLSMPCGGGTTTTVVNVGQQSSYNEEQREDDNGLVTDLYAVYDSNGNRVTYLTVGNEYHFTDIFGEQIDLNSLYITNGTVDVTGNAGAQTITFTPQLSDGETEGGGIISITTLNGRTIVYNYNVTSSNPTPVSRTVTVTANGGLFKVVRAGYRPITTSYYTKTANDGDEITLTAIDDGTFVFNHWSDAVGTHTSRVYSFTVNSSLADASGNVTIAADFEDVSVPVTATIIINAGSNGYITVGDDQTRYTRYEKTVATGTTIPKITAVANTGYIFTRWSDGSVQNNRDYVVNTNTVLSSVFENENRLKYFYVENASGFDGTLTIAKSGSNAPTVEVFYSKDGDNWDSMGETGTAGISTTVPANEILYLKANTDKWGGRYYNSINCDFDFNIGGNIMSLLNGDDDFYYAEFADGVTNVFQSLFNNNSTLISAKNLVLPPNTARACYLGMFNGCTSLKDTPELPATELINDCYNQMFQYCESLTEAPELPATKLASLCYRAMFQGCASLATAPELPATELGYGCYISMFQGCTSLTTAPELPATTLTNWCYNTMFRDCVSLTTAPVLPATILTGNCYADMFRGCKELAEVHIYANDISATDCLNNWLSDVAEQGYFYNHGQAEYTAESASGIPAGWEEIRD